MGTTSFRTADFNQKIERQLTLLSKFWEVHTDVVWSGNDEIQSLYYDFMKDNDFLTGDAPNKPKDAREKTSGLIDLGLIDNERRPTAAGESLRQITSNGDFRPNNLLQIPADSYIYFKQMLKTSNYWAQNEMYMGGDRKKEKRFVGQRVVYDDGIKAYKTKCLRGFN